MQSTPVIKEADLKVETEEVKAENATKIVFDNSIPKSIRQDFSIQIPKTIEEEYTLSTVFENKKIKEATKPVKPNIGNNITGLKNNNSG